MWEISPRVNSRRKMIHRSLNQFDYEAFGIYTSKPFLKDVAGNISCPPGKIGMTSMLGDVR